MKFCCLIMTDVKLNHPRSSSMFGIWRCSILNLVYLTLERDDYIHLRVARELLVSKFCEDPKNKDARVYISHDLCQTQYLVWRNLSKAKEGVIKHARIHRGYVYVKTELDKPPQRIISMEMLNNLIN